MRTINLRAGHDMLTTAMLLADGSLHGPLTLEDDGQPIAVMIRYRAWAPRMDQFVFIDGRYRCDTCRRSGTGFALPPGVSLQVLLDGANAHWRDVHAPKKDTAAPKTPVKGPAARAADGYVANLHDAQERLGVRYGCAPRDVKQLRNAQTMIGWQGRVGDRRFYLLRDGRSDGPFAGEHALRQAAYKAATQARLGEAGAE